MASKRIKGLTVEINGSTTGLEKALGKVNSAVGNAQAKLKDLNKLLKLDPSNTELLEQKQRTLKEAIGATKDKLETLKKAQEDAKRSLAEGKIGQDQFDALTREIIETENALKDLEKEAKNLPSAFQAGLQETGKKLKEVSGKIQEVGGNVTEAGKTLTAGVTAPIAAVAGASVAAWNEVDTAMDTVVKKTGASGEALEDMQQRAKNIAESIPTDFQTAADAVGEVNTRFGLTGDALEELSGKFVKFAELNETDVSNSVDKVQAAMAAWNVPAEDAGKVLDLFNKAGQDTGISVDKLSDLLKANKTALDEAGLSMSDSAMFLANLDKNGIDAGTALTGLKKALQNATKDGKTSKQALDELQQKMGEGSEKADAYAAAVEIFGSKAGPAIADACREGRLSFEELGTSMEDFAGNVEQTFDQTLDPVDELKMSMNTMKDLGSEIVESAAPMIAEALGMVRDVVKDLKEKWDGLDDNQKETIIKIAGIAAAIGPVLLILGTVITMIAHIVGAVGAVITVLGAPLLLPIAAVIAVITALIAIGVLVVKNWDMIKEGAGKLAKGCSEKWKNFKEDTKKKFDETKTAALAKMDEMRTGAIQKAHDLEEGAEQKIHDLKEGAVQKIHDLKEDAVNKFSEIRDGAEQKIEDARAGVDQKFQDMKDGAEQKIEDVRAGVVQKFQDMKDGAVQKFQELRDGFEDKVSGIADRVHSTFDNIRSFIEDPVSYAKDFVRNAAEDIRGYFNFEWSLPDLKLPHITIGGYIDVPVLGTIPDPNQIYVDWYAKAMNRGMILDSPTIFGMQGGKFLGGGEAGSEAIVGTNSLQAMIRQAVQSAGTSEVINCGGVEIVVNAPSGMDVRQLAKVIESQINSNVLRKKAGVT